MAGQIKVDTAKYSFRDPLHYVFKAPPGLTEQVVREISRQHQEPSWMLNLRLRALEIFRKKPMPTWGADLSGIDFAEIVYYLRPSEKHDWRQVPKYIKRTFDRWVFRAQKGSF